MSKELKVGILTIIAGVILYFGFNYLKGASFISTYNTYYMVYNDINGLTISNPVVVNGLSVGKVKNLELMQDGKKNRIKVTIDVEDKIKVGDGTEAILKSSDLLGSKMILLKLGPNQEVFPSGHELIAKTEKSITEELEERAKPVLENIDSTITKVRGFIDPDDKTSFKSIIKNMESTSLMVRRMTNETRQNTNLVAGNLISLSAQLVETEKKLTPLIAKMNNFGDSLNSLNFDNTLRQLDTNIRRIDTLLAALNSSNGTIGKLVNDPALYDSLNSTLGALQLTVEHLNVHPRYYIPLAHKPEKLDSHWVDERFDDCYDPKVKKKLDKKN